MAAEKRRRLTNSIATTSAEFMVDFNAFSGFEEASGAALEFLKNRFGFALWMMTRREGNDWIVLNARDDSYGIRAGDVLAWSDSFCSRMVLGLGPMIAPDSTRVPVYASAPVAEQLDIGAYVGTPVCAPDGSLFGTLCAIDPSPQSAEIEQQLPLVRLISTLLATVLSAELRAQEETRRAEREVMAANQDALTRVGTRRLWDTIVAAEEERCRIVGTRAAVIVVDLDGLKEINDAVGHHAGDELLATAASAIATAVRRDDIVARVGGDEFAVLALDCSENTAVRLSGRIRKALDAAHISGSVGYGLRMPNSTIDDAWRRADKQMYREKHARSRAA